MAIRLAAAGFGAVFGFAITWGQFEDPDRIREMLLLSDPYLYLMMGTAVVVGFAGTRLLKRIRVRALLTGKPVRCETERPARRHVVGGAIFGLGWALADTCPAPIASQVAQGVWWSLFTVAGVFMGILAYFRWQERPLAEPKGKARAGQPQRRLDSVY